MKKSMTAQALAKPLACRCGTGILPVFHGRDAHATGDKSLLYLTRSRFAIRRIGHPYGIRFTSMSYRTVSVAPASNPKGS